MSVKPYLWALGLLWGLPAVAVTVGYLLLDKRVPPSECESVMFGCVSEADAVLFLGMMSAYVLIPAGAAVVAVIAVVQMLRSRRRDQQTAADTAPPAADG